MGMNVNTAEGKRQTYVYFAHDGVPGRRVKIGISVAPEARMRQLRCELLFAIPCECTFARKLEQALHQEFADRRIPGRRRGEGHTEWFATDRRLSDLISHVRMTRTWPWTRTEVVMP